MSELPTRIQVWQEISQHYRTEDERRAAWVTTNVIRRIPEDEWAAGHVGVCEYCGRPGRLYARGWRCDDDLAKE